MNYLSVMCRALPQGLSRVIPSFERSLEKPLERSLVRSFHFLQPVESTTTTQSSILKVVGVSLVPARSMKQKGRLRLRCQGCYYTMRQGRLYVMCNLKPRHKQMAMQKKEKNTWILTHATQSPMRPW
ncbi:hypothetical protein OTU49_004410 [Cherax quadricarinatus]|uniref:Large ribosomal subunit protein bL36m n=1 Tax=Cherax quadricarinatus TaxID=27406 RepID=A0AAW0YP64_CHEQU|nr:uncharacterized protein LOC128704805 [Cherax quadricarinatus]XP_053655931.1 uncharacterized protein LOC128704805 [Cherax quadricarinatus]